jgi:hypothetical protein
MSKESRFIPRIVAGLLAIGGVGAVLHEKEPVAIRAEIDDTPKEEKEDDSLKKKELGPEADPVFRAEHPITAELLKHGLPLEKIQAAINEASESIRSHRYGDPKNEEKYFSVCRDQDRWSQIQKSIQFASEKTGVPERVLIAMGFIESQFNESAERSDTEVYGPYQMTLDTAKEAAKDAEEVFGFPIEVKTVEDLRETKTAVRLAALRLRALEKYYGQLGFAIVDYAGGRVGLEKKIKEAFPDVDMGAQDWKDMERHHLAERQAQKQRNELLKRMKQGRATDTDRKSLREVVGRFEAAGRAYTLAKKNWSEKRTKLPKSLEDAGATELGLYEYEKERGGSVPESIIYPLALERIAERAEWHKKDAAEKTQKNKTDQAKL